MSGIIISGSLPATVGSSPPPPQLSAPAPQPVSSITPPALPVPAAHAAAPQVSKEGEDEDLSSYESSTTVYWNGKKYSLYATETDGAGKTKNLGYSKQEWKRVTQQMISIWNEMQPAAFSSGTLDIDKGTWKTTDGTVDLASANAPLKSAFDSFSSTYNSLHPRTVMREAPKQSVSQPATPRTPQAPALEPDDSPIPPPPAPPVDEPWWKRVGKNVPFLKRFF